MEVFRTIKKRRSIRKFKPDPIPDDKLKIILEAARLAPSAGNRQPWRFVVVREDETRKKLAEAGIQTSVHYPAVHQFQIYKDFFRELTVTEYVSNNLITLPMYSSLTYSDINYIYIELKKILSND